VRRSARPSACALLDDAERAQRAELGPGSERVELTQAGPGRVRSGSRQPETAPLRGVGVRRMSAARARGQFRNR
jgi:hypothetical protein